MIIQRPPFGLPAFDLFSSITMKPTLNILLAIICLQGLAIPTMQGYAAMQRHDYLAYALHAISIGINAVFAAINIVSAVRKLRDEND